MLKAKRIAKVILCVCIAFSMFITVFADNILLEVNQYEGQLNQSAGANSFGAHILYKTQCDYYTGTKYKIEISVPNVTVNNYNNKTISYLLGNLFGVRASFEFNIVDNNINLTENDNIVIENYSYNNNKIIVIFTVNNNITGYPSNAITITYFSKDKGQNFIIDEPVKPYVIISEIKESKTQLLINNINETINNIIIMNNNIISFFTDKPWVILLGVTVSLLSFLIYKAKGII